VLAERQVGRLEERIGRVVVVISRFANLFGGDRRFVTQQAKWPVKVAGEALRRIGPLRAGQGWRALLTIALKTSHEIARNTFGLFCPRGR